MRFVFVTEKISQKARRLRLLRQRGVLRVQAAFVEDGADPRYVAEELAAELAVTAGWLGLSGVEVMRRGDLASELRAAVQQHG